MIRSSLSTRIPTPKNMTDMEYTTTLVVLFHSLHMHVERCMKTRDVTYQIMQNDLHRSMKEWLCTSKAEMTLEPGTRSWDESIENVCQRIDMCDHLLDSKSWKHNDPKPIQGISYATVKRHLRMIRRRIEGLMGKSSRGSEDIWDDSVGVGT